MRLSQYINTAAFTRRENLKPSGTELASFPGLSGPQNSLAEVGDDAGGAECGETKAPRDHFSNFYFVRAAHIMRSVSLSMADGT